MIARKTFPRLSLAFALLFAVCCSPMKSSRGPDRVLAAASLGATNNPLGTYEVTSDNQLRVWLDKQITFSPTNGASGTYAITATPPWATFDPTTGTLSGIPRTSADGGTTFTITATVSGATTKYGPYTVALVGDVMKEQQWHLINSGQTGYALSSGTAGNDIQTKLSYVGNVLGTGVRIAISDSGVYVGHPDLAANNLPSLNRNYFNAFTGNVSSWLGDPTPSFASGDDAHGTAVAGLAAAKGWNGIGGHGSAPEASFAGFLFIQAQSRLLTTGNYNLALNDQFTGNFDVFNFSWGDSQCTFTEYADSYFANIKNGVTNQRGGRGSSYLMAAGNDWVVDLSDCFSNVGSGYVYGNANFTEALTTPYQMAVASINADGISASYSSPGSAIWITAPGGEFGYSQAVSGASQASEPALVSTDFPGCGVGLKSLSSDVSTFDAGGATNTDCAYTNTMNGTSGATPVLSGVVALLLQANPALGWRDVKYILATTADRVDPSRTQNNQPSGTPLAGHVYELPWTKNAANHWFHDWYGFGRVNADNAVAAAKTYVAGSLGTLVETNWAHTSGTLSVSVPAGSTGSSNTIPVSTGLTIEAVQARVSVTGCAGDVGLELTSPSGTKSYLMNINSGLRDSDIDNHRFLTNAFLDEPTNGNWTLRVIESGRSSGCTPVLTNWQLNFLGH